MQDDNFSVSNGWVKDHQKLVRKNLDDVSATDKVADTTKSFTV